MPGIDIAIPPFLDRRQSPPVGYQIMSALSEEVKFRDFRTGLPGVGVIYAIESDDGFVKIGFTHYCAQARCKSLQTATPAKLRVVGSFLGTVAIEKTIHHHLAKHRIRGEWFRVDVKPFFAEMSAMQARV